MCPDDSGSQRRRFERVRADIPVRISTIEPDLDPLTGRTYFRASQERCAQSLARRRIRPDRTSCSTRDGACSSSCRCPTAAQVEAIGRVAWTQYAMRSATSDGLDCGVGIEFLGGATEQLRALEEFVKRDARRDRPLSRVRSCVPMKPTARTRSATSAPPEPAFGAARRAAATLDERDSSALLRSRRARRSGAPSASSIRSATRSASGGERSSLRIRRVFAGRARSSASRSSAPISATSARRCLGREALEALLESDGVRERDRGSSKPRDGAPRRLVPGAGLEPARLSARRF